MAGYADGIVSVAKAGGEMLFGGMKQTMEALAGANGMQKAATIRDALHTGFGANEASALTFVTGKGTKDEMRWHGGKIAGGVAGLGIGYRFLSGGGAYRDKNGNTDIAGLPFV